MEYNINISEDHEWYPDDSGEENAGKNNGKVTEQLERHAENFDKDVWSEIAEDVRIENQIDSTSVETLSERKKQFTTENPTLIEELKEFDRNPDYDTRIVQQGENQIVAEVDITEFSDN